MNVYKVVYSKVIKATSQGPRGTGVDGVANVLADNPSAAGDLAVVTLEDKNTEVNVSAVHEIARGVITA